VQKNSNKFQKSKNNKNSGHFKISPKYIKLTVLRRRKPKLYWRSQKPILNSSIRSSQAHSIFKRIIQSSNLSNSQCMGIESLDWRRLATGVWSQINSHTEQRKFSQCKWIGKIFLIERWKVFWKRKEKNKRRWNNQIMSWPVIQEIMQFVLTIISIRISISSRKRIQLINRGIIRI